MNNPEEHNKSEKRDWAFVGKKDILTSSSNVNPAPPSVNRPIATPSIYIDERGEIHNLKVGVKRINLLSSRKGVMRSGDIHQNTQHDFVFSGAVEVWRLTKDQGTVKTIYKSYDHIRIDPFVPHIFHFLEDTVMAEWWEPQGFYAWFYEPYRRLVQESFQRTQPGRFSYLQPVDHQWTRQSFMVVATALVAGVTAGYCLGASKKHR